MRDKTHIEQVERWANYVRDNPDKWKSELKLFLDGQLEMAMRFRREMEKTEEGRDILKRMKEERLRKK